MRKEDQRPVHYQNPKAKQAHVLIVYRNFALLQPPAPTAQAKALQRPPQAPVKPCHPPHPPHPPHPHPSHVGLGVNALNTAKVLRAARIRCDVSAVWDANNIRQALLRPEHATVTHCVIEAPFVGRDALIGLLREFPTTHFLCRTHSNIGFLQVEAGAIDLLRQYLIVQDTELNFDCSSNSKKLASFVEETYSGRCHYMPNLYDLRRVYRKPVHARNTHLLRVCSFGAVRLMKNHTTAAAAAMMLARREHVDLEFYVNVNREEHGKGVINSLHKMFDGLRWAKLIEVPWESWAHFRRTIGTMDLTYQISMSETFNLVSADSVSEGVPVCGSEAIEWLPKDAQCEIDDAEEAATVGARILRDQRAAERQLKALTEYQRQALKLWLDYLSNKTCSPKDETEAQWEFAEQLEQ